MSSLSLRLGLRFFNSKRRAVLSRFMSLAATAGIAVGVFALIVGLSAMNGFERELHSRVLAVIPAAQIKAQSGYFMDAAGFAARLEDKAQIEAALPVLELEGVFSNGRDFAPAVLYGIDPAKQLKVTALEPFLSQPLNILDSGAEEAQSDSEPLPIILGAGIVRRLKLEVGDTLRLYVSTAADKTEPAAAYAYESESSEHSGFNSALFKSPRVINVRLAGLLTIGGQLDGAVSFASLKRLQQRLELPGVNQIQLKTASLMEAQSEAYQAAAASAPEACYVESWLSSQGKLYHDIQMIRGIMYLAMILVMAVASFNIVSTLVMAVSEKKREIAILLTMGAPRSLIVKAFCVMGLLSGLKGTAIGAVLGVAGSLSLTKICAWIENIFGIKFLNADIYFISFIPAELRLTDVMLVVICALAMSLLASLYPALRASKLQPAQELNS